MGVYSRWVRRRERQKGGEGGVCSRWIRRRERLKGGGGWKLQPGKTGEQRGEREGGVCTHLHTDGGAARLGVASRKRGGGREEEKNGRRRGGEEGRGEEQDTSRGRRGG